jgi:hypothetical protein
VSWTATALLRREGAWSIRTTNIGLWDIAYTVNPHVELGVAVTVPILNVGVMPAARFAAQLADGVALGLSTQLGCWLPYPDADMVLLVWNATPALTIGSPDLFLNVALGIWGLTIFDRTADGYEADEQYSTLVLFLPSIGGSWRVSRLAKIHAELLAPGLIDVEGESVFPYGEAWALSYGVRVLGEAIWGDIGFVMPLFKYAWSLIQYVPFGIPLLRFGVQW